MKEPGVEESMKCTAVCILGLMMWSAAAFAQTTFMITGTRIPADLLKLNYGPLPTGILAYDLNICNENEKKESLTSSQVFQALAQSTSGIQPIGRQIMLAAILRNQRRGLSTILSVALNSATGVLSVLRATRSNVPAGTLAGAALGSMVVQQLLTGLRPVLSADEVEKFEGQVLEPALVLDGGSCVERTVFTVTSTKPASKTQYLDLSFHVR
jgi:hypothetical protein